MTRIGIDCGADGSAGDDDVVMVVKDQALAGTGGELGLIEVDGYLWAGLDHGTGGILARRANLAKQLLAGLKLFGAEDVDFAHGHPAVMGLLPGSQGNAVVLGTDGDYIKRLAGGHA